ncbi:hypothetical protein D3C80_1253690 [compost metagenome]
MGPIIGHQHAPVRRGDDRGVGQAAQGVGDEAIQIAQLLQGGAQGVDLLGDDVALTRRGHGRGQAGNGDGGGLALERLDLALHIG